MPNFDFGVMYSDARLPHMVICWCLMYRKFRQRSNIWNGWISDIWKNWNRWNWSMYTNRLNWKLGILYAAMMIFSHTDKLAYEQWWYVGFPQWWYVGFPLLAICITPMTVLVLADLCKWMSEWHEDENRCYMIQTTTKDSRNARANCIKLVEIKAKV